MPPAFHEMKNCIKWIYRLGYPSILMQTFFFISLLGLQTCIVPVLSYNYASKQYKRCQLIMKDSVLFSLTFMLIGIFCFEALPETLLRLFSNEADVLRIGVPAFRIIGSSFLPAVRLPHSYLLGIFKAGTGLYLDRLSRCGSHHRSDRHCVIHTADQTMVCRLMFYSSSPSISFR